MKHQNPSPKLQRTPNLQAPNIVRMGRGFEVWCLAFGISLVLGGWGLEFRACAQPTNGPSPIDLPTALRLAGAQNLDVQIAQAKLAEARANQQSAVAQFFPWLAPGISYRQHDDEIQDVAGNILDVNKHATAPGVGINAQVDLGDALYKSLAARQVAHAAAHGVEAQRQDAVLAAAQNYFELARAQSAVGVARDSVRISTEYDEQINRAVAAQAGCVRVARARAGRRP